MADLLARFKLVDEFSERLSAIAARGQQIVSQMERLGQVTGAAFNGIESAVSSVTGTIDGVAESIGSIQDVAGNASSSADALADSMNSYGNATTEAVSQADNFAEAVEGCSEGVEAAAQSASELSEAGQQTAEALTGQQAAMQQCEQAATVLGDAMVQSGHAEEELADAMQRAAQQSEELANSQNVSAETQEQLSQTSEQATEAMEQLTAAQREAQAAMAEYDQLTSSGSASLEQLAQSSQRVSQATSGLIQANGRATTATNELSQATQTAAREAQQGSDQATSAAEQLSNALAAAGIAEMVSRITESLMEASAAAAEFETATMKISTIADTTRVPLDQMSADIMALSRETGDSVTGLSEAVYQALSASVDTASAVEFTGTATKLAAGGFTDSATAVDVLTTALNAYKLEASEAEHIADMLITTQNLGKTSVGELAASVGKVIPLASAYGVEMDNLSAAYAELTKGGIATAEAGTYIKAMLGELGDSGSDVSEVLIARTGQSFAQLTQQGYSLGDVMAVLGESVDGNAGAFNELWSSSEAGIGALALYNAGAAQFNTTLSAMQNSTGATQSAFDTMSDTVQDAQEDMTNAAHNLQISVGQSINPMIRSFYELGASALNSASNFVQAHPIITKALSAVAVALSVVTTGVIAYTAAVDVVIPALVKLGPAIATALGPIGIGITVVAGITTAIVAFAATLDKTEDAMEGMTASTREQYGELQSLNSEYEEACAKFGANSEEALRLKYQLDDLSASFEANKQTVEAFTEEANKLCESISKISNGFKDSMSEIDSQETGTLALIQKYADLSSQTELTEVEQQQLAAVTKSLSSSYPKLAHQMETASLSTDEYTAALKRACEQEAEEQRQQQAQDAFLEALRKKGVLQDEIAKAEHNIRLEEERMNNISGLEHLFKIGEWDDLNAYKETLNQLNAAATENEAVMAQIGQRHKDVVDSIAQAAEGTISYQQAVSTAYQGVQQEIDNLCAAYDEAYSAAMKSFHGQFGLFDKAQADMKNTVYSAQAAVDSQMAYWENYTANIEALTEFGKGLTGEAKENFATLMAYVSSGTEEAAGLSASMIHEIENGNGEVVLHLTDTLGKVNEMRGEAAAAVADWQTDFTESLSTVKQTMQDAIAGMDLSAEAQESASATISEYVAQISAGAGEAAAAAESVKQQIESALSGEITIDASFKLDAGEIESYTMPDVTAEAEYILESSEVDNYMPDDKEADAIYNVDSSNVDSWKPQDKTATLTYNIVTKGSVPSGSVQADAHGTTNAANVFIAGEEGPELVARPAAAYATGTTNSNDFFIAGENGPELIVGEQGSTVFPTSETDRLIQTLNGMDSGAGGYSGFASKNTANNGQTTGSEYNLDTDSLSQVMFVGLSQLLVNALEQRLPALPNAGGAENNSTNAGRAENKSASEKSLHITLDVTGHGSFETQANDLNKDSIVEMIADNIRPMMIKALKQELFEEGEETRDF